MRGGFFSVSILGHPTAMENGSTICNTAATLHVVVQLVQVGCYSGGGGFRRFGGGG